MNTVYDLGSSKMIKFRYLLTINNKQARQSKRERYWDLFTASVADFFGRFVWNISATTCDIKFNTGTLTSIQNVRYNGVPVLDYPFYNYADNYGRFTLLLPLTSWPSSRYLFKLSIDNPDNNTITIRNIVDCIDKFYKSPLKECDVTDMMNLPDDSTGERNALIRHIEDTFANDKRPLWGTLLGNNNRFKGFQYKGHDQHNKIMYELLLG